MKPMQNKPNQALEPTGVHVTLAASAAAFPPTAQPSCHARPWLSLGSLGVSGRTFRINNPMNRYRTIIVKHYPPGCRSIGEHGRMVVRVAETAECDLNIALNAACRLFWVGNSGPVLGVEQGDSAPEFIEDRDPDWHHPDQPAWVVSRSAEA